MVVGWTLIGPEKTIFDAAIESDSRNYRFIEVTPLYIGQFYSKTSSYGAKKFLVGGAIEPFAFAMKGGERRPISLRDCPSFLICFN